MNMQPIVIEQMAIEHRADLYQSSVAARPFVRTSGTPASQSLAARVAGWFRTSTLTANRPAAIADR